MEACHGALLSSEKDIEAALRHAENQGWRVEIGGSHAWGKMYCPWNDAACHCGEFCIACIWSTPKNATNHARALRRVVDHCTAQKVILDIMYKKPRR